MPKYKGGLGFRDMEIFNLALLARQTWRVTMDPDSLSGRVLKAKYHVNADFLQADLGQRHPKSREKLSKVVMFSLKV